jgi:hypothetical protein
LSGGAEMLTRAPDELLYEVHRARAFALASQARTDEALDQLNEGWTDDRPNPASYAADVARVRYLVGDYDDALVALGLAVRSADHLEPTVPELAADCVRRSPRLWRDAVRIALSGGTYRERVRAALAVVRARF